MAINPEIYKRVDDEVVKLHLFWQVYRNVYAVSKDQIDLLNSVDDIFFGITQQIFFNEVILHISRLTDKETQGKNQNLSLVTLINNVNNELSEPIQKQLYDLQQQLNENVVIIRKKRSKSIAHLDYEYAVNNEDSIGISRQEIEIVLEIIRKILNIIKMEIEGSYKEYQLITTNSSGALSSGSKLISYLNKKKKNDFL
jgi:hypothetical protein